MFFHILNKKNLGFHQKFSFDPATDVFPYSESEGPGLSPEKKSSKSNWEHLVFCPLENFLAYPVNSHFWTKNLNMAPQAQVFKPTRNLDFQFLRPTQISNSSAGPSLKQYFFTASLCVNCPKSWWIQVIFKNILLNLNSRPSKIGSLRTFKLKRFVLVVSTVC